MFLSRNKKNNVYPCKPQFKKYYIKMGFKGSKLYRRVFVMNFLISPEENIGCGIHWNCFSETIPMSTYRSYFEKENINVFGLKEVISSCDTF